MNKVAINRSIKVCRENGARLLEDAKLLLDWSRSSTALALAILAQEEFAKAFILELVENDALPWLPEVHRSMVRHQSKHLLGIVMEWLPAFDFELLDRQHKAAQEKHELKMAWYQRQIDRHRAGIREPASDDPEPSEEEFFFPSEVATALNIYRFEEIERLHSGTPWRNEEWSTGSSRKVADGLLDRKKQSALYVDITKSGEVGLHPGLITYEDAVEAIARAERISDPNLSFSDEYRRLNEVLPLVFANLKTKSAASGE